MNVKSRDVNFPEFYFPIREFQILRLVEYSKLTRHSAWTTHLMHECCNSVDITPRHCGWVAAPGKGSDEWDGKLWQCQITKPNNEQPESRTRADRLERVYSLANLNWLQMQCW